jgi:iron(III) transport system permease protein
MALIASAILVYLVIAPLLMSALSSFRLTVGVMPFESGASWSLQNYFTVLLDPTTVSVLVNTFVFSVGSLFIGVTLSIALAFLVERTDIPFRNIIFLLILLSLGIPGVISGIAWVLLLNPTNGLVNLAVRAVLPQLQSGPFNIYSMPGLVFAQGLSLVPVTYLLTTAAFRTMDATMEDAALVAGASRFTVLRRITLPMLAPALLSAVIFQFINVVSSFDLPLIIGIQAKIPVLSTAIYLESVPSLGLPNFGVASAWSMLLLAVTLIPLIYYGRLLSKSERFATITGRGYRASRLELGRWKGVALIFVGVFTLFNFILPVLVMLWTSLQPYYAAPSAASLQRLTLGAYRSMISDPSLQGAATNTLFMGAVTALATMTLAFVIGWVIVRTRSRWRVLLDMLSFLPAALPGVTIGLSILLFYLLVPLPVRLYGTIWIVIIGLTTQSISLAVRLMSGGIVQVHRELEEASEVSGASRASTMWRIVLPLVLPTFLNGLLLVFVTSIEFLTVPLMLSAPGTQVIATALWDLWNTGYIAESAAIGVVAVVVMIPLSFALRRLGASAA